MTDPIHIISLGAGVQSSTMALMAKHGEITPMPTCAIFADTQDESKATYEWLEALERLLPFPVYITSKGKLSDNLFEWGFSQIPAFHAGSIGKRQCTKHYKVAPIRRKIRQLGFNQVNLWMGISLDEAHRMKPADVQWITHSWPLIDKRMNRKDCAEWLTVHGYEIPPKSACIFCPYHSDAQWSEIMRSGNGEWDKVIQIDQQLIQRGEYLHKSCKPIYQVDFRTAEEMGQLNLFGNECEGMCGV